MKPIGIRKVFLPSDVFEGPRDESIASVGRESHQRNFGPVSPDEMGDFLFFDSARENENLTRNEMEAVDMVHCFAVVRQTLTMYQRALARRGRPAELRWKWNNRHNNDPIKVTTDIIFAKTVTMVSTGPGLARRQ